MDYSEEMIKMCEEADELRRNWAPRVGDWVLVKYTVFGDSIETEVQVLTRTPRGGTFYARNTDGDERIFFVEDISEKTSVWMPTQDQLQGLLEEKDPIMVHADFSRFVDVWLDKHQQDIEPPTMTQLWLEYVMKKKYNKIWSIDRWILAHGEEK